MLLTLLLAVIIMGVLFLMQFAAAALIRKKRLLRSMPQDILEAMDEHVGSTGARILGWVITVLCLAGFLGVFAWGCLDGVKNGCGFWDFFARFLIMLLLLKAFDIVFLDWFLLTRTGFYQRYYPETEGCDGYNDPFFNIKEHIIQTVMMPFVALLLAWVGTTW